MSPRFSVVIPVYNRARSVLPTLESVRNQTFEDFECIVVDDGSADGAELKAVVEGLADPRFRYVRRENGGESAARTTGIDEARGEFVAFLDSDDRWLPEKLQHDATLTTPKAVVFSPMLVERNGQIVGQRPKAFLQSGEPIGEYMACRQGFVSSSTVCVDASLAREVRWNEGIVYGNDTDFAIRLGAAGANFRAISQPLSIMNDDDSPGRMSRSKDWRRVLEWIEQLRPMIGDRAFLAYRGWHVARLAADNGRYWTAFRFYIRALLSGAMPPPLAAKAVAQILVRRSVYARFR
jgi:glycosyltransferase involved in cell wall biosynthesis